MPLAQRHAKSWLWIFTGLALWGMTTSPAVAQPSAPDPNAAQAPAPEPIRPGESVIRVLTPRLEVRLLEQQSKVLEFASRLVSVDGHAEDLLYVEALSPTQLRLFAETTGVTQFTVVDEFDQVYQIDVFIEGDLRELQAYLNRLFPGSSIAVMKVRDAIVLTGWVADANEIPQITGIAQQFASAPDGVLNYLQVGGVDLVQLNVQVMEVQRSKMREFGFNFLMRGQDYYVASTPGNIVPLAGVTADFGGPPVPTFGAGSFANPQLQFAITGNTDIFHGFLQALQRESLLKILAEPKLVTMSGRPANFHAGGEFPILVPQGFGTVSIEWREFGVRMEAVPIVLGNGRVQLDIAPEVSERDFANAVEVNGFVVPGITTRRVNTQVEMRFGDTLMLGGLISTRQIGNASKIPFLGELPLIGAAFSTKDYNDAETELVILVTPHLAEAMAPCQVPPFGPGQTTDAPTDHELYLDGMLEIPAYGPECPECEIAPGMHSPYATGVIPTIPGGTYSVPFDEVPENYFPDESPAEQLLPPAEGEATSWMPDQRGYSPSVQTASATSAGGLSRSVQLGAHSSPASGHSTSTGAGGSGGTAPGLITPQERETSGRSRLTAPEPAGR